MLADSHAMDAAAVLKAAETSSAGLTQAEAEARLKSHGPNRLPTPRQRSAARRFLSHFNNILIYVLLAAAAITLALDHLVDAAVVLAVVIANAVIGFVQEGRAETAMAALRRMLAPMAAVLRDGERRSVGGEELVPGDIVLLEAGDRVPADLRLIRAHGLQIDEAILTGESMPADKRTEPAAPDAPLGDRHGMAWWWPRARGRKLGGSAACCRRWRF